MEAEADSSASDNGRPSGKIHAWLMPEVTTLIRGDGSCHMVGKVKRGEDVGQG